MREHLEAVMDWLAEKALDAIEASGDMPASWLAEKRAEYASASRLDVLRWVCHSLDTSNRACVAHALGVSADDLAATARVLQKI